MHRSTTMIHVAQLKSSIMLAGLMATLIAATPASAQSRYKPNPDGSEVTDSLTGLVWKRCVEGLIWDGTSCTGTPLVFNHEQAFTQAKTQGAWRLPNIKELASLVDHSIKSGAAFDQTAFAGATGSVQTNFGAWASTPFVTDPSKAWALSFGGQIAPAPRFQTFKAWLVRSN